MRIQPTHDDFIMPTKSTLDSGGFDIYMPDEGSVKGIAEMVGLGFRAEIPRGHAAMIFPRSGVGSRSGLELNNTVGLIDADYRGEWKAALRTKSGLPFSWEKGEKLLQFIIVPLPSIELEMVPKGADFSTTARGEGGFGSTGK